jgi:hypothetical protein
MLRRFKTAIASGIAVLTLATGAAATCPPLAVGQFRNEDLLARVDYIAGKKVLILDGGVDDNAAARVDAALRTYGPVDEVWLNSPGGNARQGTAIGQVLRRWGVSARIPSGFWCISACNFAFVGAPIRQIDPGGQYAVHMFTNVHSESYAAYREFFRKNGEPGVFTALQSREQGSALLAIEQADFLIRMGVSRRLLSEVMYLQEAAGLRCLTQAEMKRYNVVNFE